MCIGANLPKESEFLYLQKVMELGSFAAYESLHLAALAKVFVPKFPGLPEELVRLVLVVATVRKHTFSQHGTTRFCALRCAVPLTSASTTAGV